MAALIRVACIGDSITYGEGLPARVNTSYPAVLGRRLGSNYQVRNYGVGGATLLNSGLKPYESLPEYSEALAFKPQILIVGLGTNDSKYSFNQQKSAEFETDYKTLINAFRKANGAVKVYAFLPIPSYPQTRQPNLILSESILPLIKDVAQHTGAQIIDLNTPFTNRQDLYRDGYHPNTTGAALLASLVYDSLERNPATR